MLTVNKASLTVTANNVTRLLGATTPAFSVAYASFVLGEIPAGTPERCKRPVPLVG